MSEAREPFQEPEIVTYQQDELVSDTVFTMGKSGNPSDRNLKRNFGAVRAKSILAQLVRVR